MFPCVLSFHKHLLNACYMPDTVHGIGNLWGKKKMMVRIPVFKTDIPVVAVQLLSCVPLFANPMDCDMPGFPVLHHLLELFQTYVH